MKLNGNKVGACAYVFISVVVICVLIFYLVKCENKTKDNYCICTGSGPGGRGKVCQGNMRKAYNNGLTEYSNFAKMQKDAGGPTWKNVQPGQYDYPQNPKSCAKHNLAM